MQETMKGPPDPRTGLFSLNLLAEQDPVASGWLHIKEPISPVPPASPPLPPAGIQRLQEENGGIGCSMSVFLNLFPVRAPLKYTPR